MEKIIELKYSNTNTYLICGDKGTLLFDTGWAGTFPDFCKEIKKYHIDIKTIDYILISHFHPDHMGIAQDIATEGPRIVVLNKQELFIHNSDAIFEKENKYSFVPIDDKKIVRISAEESRDFLKQIGIAGEIIYSPGHSEDSISLCLDSKNIFVGDLNPLYELELHKGTEIDSSWSMLLERAPKIVYYGHAKKAVISDKDKADSVVNDADIYLLVQRIMKYIDKGYSMDKIQKKTKADRVFIEDVSRMYLTHQNVGVQGILDRIEIKGR